MHKPVAKAHLIGIAGSLRKVSYSSAACGIMFAAMATLETVICGFHCRVRMKMGRPRRRMCATFGRRSAPVTAFVIVTPEYNHGIPGVLKNALDWTSRPFGKSVLIGKPVLVMSVSPAFTGGVRAHVQVNELCSRSRRALFPVRRS
jgi:chromate reductase, NAD(P)H dehydrogenase (quinone)